MYVSILFSTPFVAFIQYVDLKMTSFKEVRALLARLRFRRLNNLKNQNFKM